MNTSPHVVKIMMGAVTPWKHKLPSLLLRRSMDRHNIRYVGMLGDGDSKAYDAVMCMFPYDVEVEKEECINHAHKRMLTSLKNVQQKDRLGGRETGRLTLSKIPILQKYYGRSIRHNIVNPEGIRDAVWGTLHHIMSTDEFPTHEQCPGGSQSWCFYNRAVANNQELPSQKENVSIPLSIEVGQGLVPVYTRMSDPNFLKRLANEKTQNNMSSSTR